ncbi:MAG: UDP-4-amino-4,6-dideoxy-N-acetyl-beta-L-altrosamine transaminase [Actinomycetota bacterium]
MSDFLPYSRQVIGDDDIEAVVRSLKGDFLTTGPLVDEFERAIAEECNAAEAVVFANGTAALHAAAFAAGVGPGDESITSAISIAASANCAAFVGATPRFADIDPETVNIDAASIAKVTNPHTRSVIPVHFAGLSCDVAAVRDAAPGAIVIEDAAHAFGGRDAEGNPIGSCVSSSMTALSFHPVKSITTGEGGAVTTNDAELASRMRRFRHHGIVRDVALLELPDEGPWYHEMQDLGFNYRITDVQCALGLSQIRKLHSFVEARNEIAAWYDDVLGALSGVVLPARATGKGVHAYHLYIVRVAPEKRRAAFEALRADGIGVNVHYLPIYRHPWYRKTYGYEPGLCPNAEAYYGGALSLPVFPGMTREDVVRVARSLERAIR